jgi:hypothetical protein
MKTNQVVAVVVLVVVIAGAVVIVGRQMAGPGGPPEQVLAQQVELIAVDAPHEVKKFTNKELMGATTDPATSYRALAGRKWAPVITCNACKKPVPAAPVRADGTGPLKLLQYKCPLCGNPAYPPEE